MCTALVMVVAGVSMLANAMPSIAASLDASQSSQQWIVDAYALVLAALLLPAGAMGDRFGRRGALIAGTAIFGIGSLLSAFVSSAGPLIGLRALTGLGAALLMPGTLSTITSVFPPEERPRRSASGPASPVPVARSASSCRARCSSSSGGARSSSSPRGSPPCRASA